jgi:hypothetical protein
VTKIRLLTLAVCGSNKFQRMSENKQSNGGFSILALLFAPMYYAGYGKFGRGLIFAILLCASSILGIVAYIYAGFKAKKELPVGEKPYSWGSCIGMFFLHLILAVAFSAVEMGMEEGSGENANNNAGTENVSTSEAISEVGVNEVLDINGLEWVVTDVKSNLSLADGDFGEIKSADESTMLVIVTGKVTNRNNSIDLEAGDLLLVDNDGAEYAEHENSLGLFLDQLSKNVPKKWTSVFEVPKSYATPLKLKVSDGGLFTETTGFIVLE